jgi:glycosyltransferase involved in cell wall biosynthesis
MINLQSIKSHEVILVDNESDDDTVEIARNFGVSKIATIKNYTPGKALNLGAKLASGTYLVFISAHCVPCDDKWLEFLIDGFAIDTAVCGVYGRQVPLPESDERNTRDLLSVFRDESRLQRIDSFFHNANSAIKRQSWLENPFDMDLANLEDQAWAKSRLEADYLIYYQANAMVYHHDGLHFHQSKERTSGVVKTLKQLSRYDLNQLPIFARERMKAWYSVCLFDESKNSGVLRECIENYAAFFNQFNSIINIKHIVIASRNFMTQLSALLDEAEFSEITLFERKIENRLFSEDRDILEVLGLAVQQVKHVFQDQPEVIFFYNPQYTPPTETDLLNIISTYSSSDVDLVVLGKRIDGMTWIKESDGSFRSTDNSLLPNQTRQNVFEIFLGAGSAFSAHAIVNKNLLETKAIRIIESSRNMQRIGLNFVK